MVFTERENRAWGLFVWVPRPTKTKKIYRGRARSQASSSLVGWVCFDILKKASSGREDMREAMEVSLNQANYILERYLTALGVIASVSPLLGLLGTVIGMIDVFDTITDTGSKSAVSLAGGISTALITTASGLIVARLGRVRVIHRQGSGLPRQSNE